MTAATDQVWDSKPGKELELSEPVYMSWQS